MARKNKNIFEVIFRKKPASILILLRKHQKHKYGSILAKEADCTYSHAVKILHDMERAKLISFEKQGRIKTIVLTEKGEKVVEHLEKIKGILTK